MNSFRLTFVAMALAGLIGVATAESSGHPGEHLFKRYCQSCHGTAGPRDSELGSQLSGLFGTKAGTAPTGVHSRAAIESGIVWDRESMRRFLSDPRRTMPGTLMPIAVADPVELERLLDYLETLR